MPQGQPALFPGPWSLLRAVCFYRQGPEAEEGYFGTAGLGGRARGQESRDLRK